MLYVEYSRRVENLRTLLALAGDLINIIKYIHAYKHTHTSYVLYSVI